MTTFHLATADCVDFMRENIADGAVHAVVTSPPYNLGIRYRNYRDNRAVDDYLRWTLDWTAEVFRVLHPSGSFFLNMGAAPAHPLLPHQVVLRLAQTFQLQNTFHWVKSITVEASQGRTVSAGHFKPINSQRYVNDCHEFVFHLTKSGEVPLDRMAVGVPYADKSNVARFAHTRGRDRRCRGNCWFIPYETITDRNRQRPHPATFPTGLAEYCLRLHGNVRQLTVLDPFMGIGSTALAARRLGCPVVYGCDICPDYTATTQARLAGGAA